MGDMKKDLGNLTLGLQVVRFLVVVVAAVFWVWLELTVYPLLLL